ncbi:MAG TPA: hypothetical protein VGN12_08190 [Pirellulales bacterium]|jgi:hypothetical protein
MKRNPHHSSIGSDDAHGFIHGGQWLAEAMVRAEHRRNRPRLLVEAHARYATELAAANWFGRLLLRRRIRREVAAILRRALDRLASPFSLY